MLRVLTFTLKLSIALPLAIVLVGGLLASALASVVPPSERVRARPRRSSERAVSRYGMR